MKRRTKGLFGAGSLLVLLYITSCSIVPRIIDGKRNAIWGPRPFDAASPSAWRIHDNAVIADLHADSLIWNRDLLERNGHGQVDLPRLGEANVAVQVFSIPTQVPRKISGRGTPAGQLNLITLSAVLGGWPPRAWFRLDHRARYLAGKLHRFAQRSNGTLAVVESREQLQEFLRSRGRSRRVGGILAIEGLHALERDLDNVDRFYDQGFRIMGLLHHFDNELGGSSTGMGKGGLTPFGRQVVQRLEERSMIIDLAHASPQTIRDVASITKRPLVVSHTGVRGTCDRSRNLSDEEIRLVARSGGVVGIGFWSGATCGAGAAAIAKAIRHAVTTGGIDHVALGSDFDGDRMPFDATGMVRITDALLAEGFSEGEIRKVMGGNLVRVLLETLPAAQ